MKSSNIIKLLAALLCVVMMFVSCADSAVAPETNGVDSLSGTAGTLPTLSDTTGTEDVEPTEPLKLSDFIEFINKDKVYSTVEDAPEGVIDAYENYYLIYDYSVDAMNQATYSYEVVNIETGESYKKWEYTFDQASPDSETYVWFETAGNVAIIAVADIKYSEITDAMREESYLIADNDRYYVESVSISAYDLYGNTVFENKSYFLDENIEFEAVDRNNSITSYVLYVCDGSYYLFDKDGKYVKAVEATSTEKLAFDYENDTYGYYLRAVHYDDYAIQVYEKATGKLVYYKVYESFMENREEGAIVNVLSDGTVFIQEIRRAYEKEAYDFHTPLFNLMFGSGAEFADEAYMLDSYTVKFTNENGEFKAVEAPVELDYIYLGITDAESYGDMMDMEGVDIVIGEKAVNVAMGFKIVDRAISINSLAAILDTYLFIDNELNVQYVPETIVPLSGAFVYEKLDNGYSYVTISLNGENDLIALYDAEGKFVRYLTSDNVLMNGFIVNSYGIFDYDFNCMYEFDETETVECYLGDSVIISEYIPDDPENDYDEERFTMYRLTLKVENAETEEGSEAEAKPTYSIKKDKLYDITDIDEQTDDYVVLYNEEDETFNLYNRDFELLFVSMNSYNIEYNDYLDAYMMSTYIKDGYRYYIIK